MLKKLFVVICLIISIAGCSTVRGPSVSQGEIEAAREELKVKALGYQLKQLEMVSNIGYKLVLNLPQNPSGKTYSYTGLIAAGIDKYVKRLFNLSRDRGIVVVAVLANSPAEKAGIKKGDIIKSVDGKSFETHLVALLNYLEKAKSGAELNFKIEREGLYIDVPLVTQAASISVRFQMVDMPEVNAAATADNYILYTYGMVKFAGSDDEIAIILGHELAHLVRGHVAKMQGVVILSDLLALVLGTVAESQSPGSGSVVMEGTQNINSIFAAKYSRDLENEADYFGIHYVHNAGFDVEAGVNVWERFAIEIPQSMIGNFLSTHSSSPERMIRIRKIIQELKVKLQ